VLCTGTFLVTTSGTSLAPFLIEMARDLGTDLAAVANLLAISSLTWGVLSLLAGAASDRIGRGPVLAAATLALATARIGLALARTYPAAAGWALLTGAGGGGFMGTVFATVSDHAPAAQRGRALGWVITGQSLSLVFGVPLVTLIGSLAGWRGATAAHGLATLVVAGAVWLVVPAGGRTGPAAGGARVSLLAHADRRVWLLLAASAMERTCFASMAVYLATFLRASYDPAMTALAVALALVAAGNLLGNTVGGWAADRLPSRPLTYAVSSLATGALALPLLGWRPGLGGSIALGFAYALANAVGRPALMASLSEVPGEVRGAILGLNITMSSFGWLGASALGGVLVTGPGFASLGLLGALAAVAGAALAAASVRAGRRSRR
jgi:predicted MFS family arabinose efflux permease